MILLPIAVCDWEFFDLLVVVLKAISVLTLYVQNGIIIKLAVVAELAYAHDSGSCPLTRVWVQVPSTAFLFYMKLFKKSIAI